MSATEGKAATVDAATVAAMAIELAKKAGAQDAAIVVERHRAVECAMRERKVEKLQESAGASLSAALFVDGRYSSHSTSDLRKEALERFLANAVAMTRLLEKDPFRTLPDPKLYEGRAKVDLALHDPAHANVSAQGRKEMARAVEEAALSAGGEIQSVEAEVGDTEREYVRLTTNGFEGRERSSSFYAGASVTMRDGMKRPEDAWYMSSRRLADLGDAAAIGREATARAKARMGAKKVAGGAMTVVIENRAAGRLLSYLLGAASAAALQQKRSFLDGKIGQKVASERLTLIDDPLIPLGMGSRLFDGEGFAARRMPVLEAGVLRNYYVDWYYGKKIGLAPTTGGASNLVIAPGTRSLDEILASLDAGILVTSFLGGNSNGLTGDFSVGIQGQRIEKGRRVEPVGEMNLAGNHKELWHQVAEVGADVWTRSSIRSPSLVLAGVSVAGA